MRVRVGTSGYSYKEWKGSFYPEKTKPAEMLAYYSSRLDTVEINATYYRMPAEKVLLHWAAQVPADFTFVLKASRRITHQKKLVDARDELDYLLKTAAALGDKLGPLLFQLPPFLKKDVARLRDFLSLLPDGQRAAFEFRNPSWFDDEVYNALRDGAAALVVSDQKTDDPPVVPTAGFGYFRLRDDAYDEARLEQWAGKLTAQPWEEASVFFKHEDEGAGPALAERFHEILAESGHRGSTPTD